MAGTPRAHGTSHASRGRDAGPVGAQYIWKWILRPAMGRGALVLAVLVAGFNILAPEAYAGTGQGGAGSEFLMVMAPAAALLTAAATMVFVILMRKQLGNQKTEHELTLKPIIVNDKNTPAQSVQYGASGITVRLINVGNIPASKTRIMTIPPAKYSEFSTRERALKEYLRGVGSGTLGNTDACIVLRPIRERMKRVPEANSPTKYLVLGDDFGRLAPAIKAFDEMIDGFKDKDARKRFDEAGRARAESLVKLNPHDWDRFYLVGSKRGDLLDRIGPIDWEVFDKKAGRDKVYGMLGEFAEEVYGTAGERKRIIENMSGPDREQYYKALRERIESWDILTASGGSQEEAVKKYVDTSMALRRTYRSVKVIKSSTYDVLAHNHPVEVPINVDDETKKMIEAGEYVYFAVLVQYGKPGEKDFKYVHYVQGYVNEGRAYLDYTADTLG